MGEFLVLVIVDWMKVFSSFLHWHAKNELD